MAAEYARVAGFVFYRDGTVERPGWRGKRKRASVRGAVALAPMGPGGYAVTIVTDEWSYTWRGLRLAYKTYTRLVEYGAAAAVWAGQDAPERPLSEP